MRRFHLALGVKNLDRSIEDYSKRLGCGPEAVVKGKYALWRMEGVNFSVRVVKSGVGRLRHVGWEDPEARRFTSSKDVNGIVWENFSAKQQREEIREVFGKKHCLFGG